MNLRWFNYKLGVMPNATFISIENNFIHSNTNEKELHLLNSPESFSAALEELEIYAT